MADPKIGLDVSDAVKALNELNSSVNGTLDSISSSFKSIALGGAFIAFFAKAAHSATEQEDAINRLNVALKLNKNLTDETSNSLQNYAETLQASSKFADDVILNNIALLQTLAPLNEKGLKAGTQAATDLASALRIDLGTAFELVGKAANGNIGAFARYGVEVKKGQTDAETFSNTLTVLNSKFGGSAAEEIKTYSGSIAQLSNQFGEVLEETGNFIIKNSLVKSSIANTSLVFEAYTDTLKILNAVFNGSAASVDELARSFNSNRSAFEENSAEFAKQEGVYEKVIARAKELSIEQNILSQSLPDFANASSAVDDFSKGLAKAASSMKDTAEESKSASLFLANAKKEAKDFSAEIKSLEGTLKNAGLNRLEIISKERTERLKLIDDAFKAETINDKKAAELRRKAQKEFDKEFKEESKKIAQTNKESEEKGKQKEVNDITAFLDILRGDKRQTGPNAGDPNALAAGTKLALTAGVAADQIVKGAEGAVGVLKAGFSFALSAALGPLGTALGQTLGPLLEVFAQGPEKVKELITEFFQSFPTIAKNIVLSIPAAVQAILSSIPGFLISLLESIIPQIDSILLFIVEGIPTIIESIIERLPEIAIKLIEVVLKAAEKLGPALAAQMPLVATRLAIELTAQMPKIAVSFINELIKESPRFITELIKSIPKAGIGAVTGIGDSIGGFFSGVGDIFGFAEGGRIPNDPRFKNDGAIIRADAGEQILSGDLSARLEKFLNGGDSRNSQNLSINLSVGESELANVLVNLNRNGFRTV